MQALAAETLLFIDHFKLIATTNVLSEIYVIGEDLRQRHGLTVAQTGLLGRQGKGAADHATGVDSPHLGFGDLVLDGKPLDRLADFDAFQFVQIRAQGLQLAIGGEGEFEFLAGFDAAQVFGRLLVMKDFLQDGCRNPCLGKNCGKGIALARGHHCGRCRQGWRRGHCGGGFCFCLLGRLLRRGRLAVRGAFEHDKRRFCFLVDRQQFWLLVVCFFDLS